MYVSNASKQCVSVCVSTNDWRNDHYNGQVKCAHLFTCQGDFSYKILTILYPRDPDRVKF